MNRQLFALAKLDVTKDGADEIIACSWDGHTYIFDQKKNSVRFQLNESVQAFEVGYYTLKHGSEPVTCFVYVTFRNKVSNFHESDIVMYFLFMRDCHVFHFITLIVVSLK